MSRAELERVLNDVADALADEGLATARDSAGGSTTWSRAGVAIAVLGDAGVELRLEPRIAAAAARTPDTAPSGRGPEWVRFNPRSLDPHAIDRLDAWFRFAARRAPKGPGSGARPS